MIKISSWAKGGIFATIVWDWDKDEQ